MQVNLLCLSTILVVTIVCGINALPSRAVRTDLRVSILEDEITVKTGETIELKCRVTYSRPLGK